VSSSESDILQNTNSKEEETAILFSGAVLFSVMSVFLFFVLLHFPRSSAVDKSLPYKISQLIAASQSITWWRERNGNILGKSFHRPFPESKFTRV